MSRVIKHRKGPLQNHDTIYPEVLPEFAADGIADVTMTSDHVKLTLFQTRSGVGVEPDPDVGRVEQRQAALVLTMSLPVVVEGFTKVLAGIVDNQEGLLDANRRRLHSLERMLTELKGAVQFPSDASDASPAEPARPKKPVRKH